MPPKQQQDILKAASRHLEAAVARLADARGSRQRQGRLAVRDAWAVAVEALGLATRLEELEDTRDQAKE